MNDFVQLNPPSDVYEAETMVEGNLHPPTTNCCLCLVAWL